MNFMELSELLGNWGEFIGAIAVVLTLIYLSVQVRQNSVQIKASVDAMQVTGYQQLMNRIAEVNRLTIEDADFARILLLAESNPEELAEVDVRRFYTYMILLTRHADMAFLQYQKGMLDEDQYHSALGPFVGTLRGNFFLRRSVARVAESKYSVFTKAFREELLRLLDETEGQLALADVGPRTNLFAADLAAYREAQ